MRCLLVRQPYASLISYGIKRIEFRNRNCNIRETIAIAASKGPSIKTSDPKLNAISNEMPKGKILALGKIVSSNLVSKNDLFTLFKGKKRVDLHGISLSLAETPLGEPIDDIVKAVNDSKWWAYAWYLSKINAFEEPIEMSTKAYGSWVCLNDDDYKQIDSHCQVI